MKNVLQLDSDGYFVGVTTADESPLEPGVFQMPAGAIDATAPVVNAGHRAKWNGSTFDFEPIPADETNPEIDPPTFQKQIDSAVLKIDADVDSITATVIGNRGVEYVEAEAQAFAYQQADYSGPVPSMVQAWVDAKAIEGVPWTATQAADDILATATAWRGAVGLIRSNRLNAKAYVRIAVDEGALATALVNWAAFVAAIRSQLGI